MPRLRLLLSRTLSNTFKPIETVLTQQTVNIDVVHTLYIIVYDSASCLVLALLKRHAQPEACSARTREPLSAHFLTRAFGRIEVLVAQVMTRWLLSALTTATTCCWVVAMLLTPPSATRRCLAAYCSWPRSISFAVQAVAVRASSPWRWS